MGSIQANQMLLAQLMQDSQPQSGTPVMGMPGMNPTMAPPGMTPGPATGPKSGMLAQQIAQMMQSTKDEASGYRQGATGRGGALANSMSRLAQQSVRDKGQRSLDDMLRQQSEAVTQEEAEARQRAQAASDMARERKREDYVYEKGIDKQFAVNDGSSTNVQSAEILPDGTTVQIRKNGDTSVTGPQGNELTGKPRQDAIVAAVKFGAANQGDRSRSRALGSGIANASIEIGQKAFERLTPIRSNIANLDKVVDAIDRGAETGYIDSMLPSVRAAAIELDNIQKELGLDVIGDATFGALSKGELDLALSKALPTDLQPAELRQWALDKKVAQEKLADELGRAARFFSMGGTINEYLTRQDQEAAARTAGQSTAAPAANLTPEAGTEQTATGPNGETLVLRGGQWVPM
jgi:hypothetical protein